MVNFMLIRSLQACSSAFYVISVDANHVNVKKKEKERFVTFIHVAFVCLSIDVVAN